MSALLFLYVYSTCVFSADCTVSVLFAAGGSGIDISLFSLKRIVIFMTIVKYVITFYAENILKKAVKK